MFHLVSVAGSQGSVCPRLYQNCYIATVSGIKKKESYLSELNAKTIWLSSILKTDPGNDRAVLHYKELDEKFGTIEGLKAYCKKLTKEGGFLLRAVFINLWSEILLLNVCH